MNHRCGEIQGAGLGLRRPLLEALAAPDAPPLDFLELAPENWIGVGGILGRKLRVVGERYPLIAHGLSLSLGGPAPLDTRFISRIAAFLAAHDVRSYSEHLSYCADDGQLYDLMPIPFTSEAVHHVAARIRQTQDILGQRIAVENVSYYAAPGQRLTEAAFINAVLEEADCDLLLDVNNVHVNSVNHGYDARAFIDAMPRERIRYLHVAGHYVEAPDLLVDSHGADVPDPVWALLDYTCRRCGVLPTLLERDFNIPPLAALCAELAHIRALQTRHIQGLPHARTG